MSGDCAFCRRAVFKSPDTRSRTGPKPGRKRTRRKKTASSSPIRRVLIANRGEIAVRIIRTCRRLGIVPIAVYAPADARAPHVLLADAAYPLPLDPPVESYLNVARLLEVAQRARADAVHPGYGFLSEAPAFAAACLNSGLRFVGPPPDVLSRCGDKALTRALVQQAGVPVLPGTGVVTDDEAMREANRIGLPVLLKAAAGGGGKGIHLVRSPDEMHSAMRLARGEARSAFGDDRIYLERWLERPRHVEVQVLADAAGAIATLGERDCSVQRRHQKVIEESPSPGVGPKARARLMKAAAAAAAALGYVNAGTVEFLLDGDEFYFIEVNARLQVEHPVTEMISGLDLVEQQLRIAEGGTLDASSRKAALRGHAIECRVGAEDPHHGFLPSQGTIAGILEPGGPGIRVDSGVSDGLPVTRHFDPLLAKVIAWGESREMAAARMTAALDEMQVSGVRTTLPFLRWAVRDDAFRTGRYDLGFSDRWDRREVNDEAWLPAAVAAALWTHEQGRRLTLPRDSQESRWRRAARLEASVAMDVEDDAP